MQHRIQTAIITALKILFLLIIIFGILRSFVFATSQISGNSMDPTLKNGQYIYINKLAYAFDNPKRGDIIIINRPDKRYIKRIIGLPNETIEIKDDQLYINKEPYTQPFLTNQRIPNVSSIVIPENSYYVLGDNRKYSKDSSNGLGFVKQENIIGRTDFVIYPFSEWKSIK